MLCHNLLVVSIQSIETATWLQRHASHVITRYAPQLTLIQLIIASLKLVFPRHLYAPPHIMPVLTTSGMNVTFDADGGVHMLVLPLRLEGGGDMKAAKGLLRGDLADGVVCLVMWSILRRDDDFGDGGGGNHDDHDHDHEDGDGDDDDASYSNFVQGLNAYLRVFLVCIHWYTTFRLPWPKLCLPMTLRRSMCQISFQQHRHRQDLENLRHALLMPCTQAGRNCSSCCVI